MFASMKKLVWTVNMNISSRCNNQTRFLGQKNINRTRVNKTRTCFDALHPSQQFLCQVGMFSCLPGLNRY